jgi:REP element-mobilizing transposase RayT
MKKQRTLFNQKGAGRPKLPAHKRKSIAHRKREDIPDQKPLHVTIKINKQIVYTLRNKILFKKISRAIVQARAKGLRVIHFSVQRDHIHFLLEAKDKVLLGKSMQAMMISLAKSLKFASKTSHKKIFIDRYHVHILKTLAEIRNAKLYILGNALKHGAIKAQFDPFSSVIKAPEITWKFNFKKYFKDLPHFLEYQELINSLVDAPQFYLVKKEVKKSTATSASLF